MDKLQGLVSDLQRLAARIDAKDSKGDRGLLLALELADEKLDEIEEFLDRRADCELQDGDYMPNEAMRRVLDVRQVRATLHRISTLFSSSIRPGGIAPVSEETLPTQRPRPGLTP